MLSAAAARVAAASLGRALLHHQHHNNGGAAAAAAAAAATGSAAALAAAAAARLGRGLVTSSPAAWSEASASASAGAGEAGVVREVQTAEEYAAVMGQLKDTGALGVIDFTAKWCGPCKAIAPVFEQLAKQHPAVAFLKVDIDNAALQGVVTEHGITGVPTFTVYRGARKVENFTGARVDLLRSVLQKHTAG